MKMQCDELKKMTSAFGQIRGRKEHADIGRDYGLGRFTRRGTHGTTCLNPLTNGFRVVTSAPTRIKLLKTIATLACLTAGRIGQVAAYHGMKTSIEKPKSPESQLRWSETPIISELWLFILPWRPRRHDRPDHGQRRFGDRPLGGTEAFMGTNPFHSDSDFRRLPDGADYVSSIVARGKIRAASRKKTAIPEGMGLDANGTPTTIRCALKSTLLPIGGPKGSALALIVDIFRGILSGSKFGRGKDLP